eukprot:1742323-Pleurochrysis_carterae.AAC.1
MKPRNQKDVETNWEAEAACSPAQLALLGEYHQAAVADEDKLELNNFHCNALLGTAREHWLATEAEFAVEQREAAKETTHWERYVTAFCNLHGRSPVVYDLFCGGQQARSAVEPCWQALKFSDLTF